MQDRSDPEFIAKATVCMIREALCLPDDAKVMVLVDCQRISGDSPSGLFSQISFDRAALLLANQQKANNAALDVSLMTIARAMLEPKNG